MNYKSTIKQFESTIKEVRENLDIFKRLSKKYNNKLRVEPDGWSADSLCFSRKYFYTGKTTEPNDVEISSSYGEFIIQYLIKEANGVVIKCYKEIPFIIGEYNAKLRKNEITIFDYSKCKYKKLSNKQIKLCEKQIMDLILDPDKWQISESGFIFSPTSYNYEKFSTMVNFK